MLTQLELRRLIVQRSASFAIGVRGVIAEFHWAANDTIEHDDGGLEIATARGALAIRMRGDEGLTAVTSDDGHDHGGDARVCWLAQTHARLDTPSGLTELGEDTRCVRPDDRGHRLFDLGLGIGHVRACVRTGDAALTALLREHQGDDVLAPGNPVMAAIKAHSPHRVFESASARIEVFAPIPSRSRRERTPDGPHTHLLPPLIGSADPTLEQLPHGTLPVLTVYPTH